MTQFDFFVLCSLLLVGGLRAQSLPQSNDLSSSHAASTLTSFSPDDPPFISVFSGASQSVSGQDVQTQNGQTLTITIQPQSTTANPTPKKHKTSPAVGSTGSVSSSASNSLRGRVFTIGTSLTIDIVPCIAAIFLIALFR